MMNDSVHAIAIGHGSVAEQRNKVLRNTYWLLALSLLPTVLGAWVGVSTGVMAQMGVGMSAIVFLGGAFGFIFAIEKTKDSAVGVAVLLGFTFFMGLMLSRMIGGVLGFRNGAALIGLAGGGTAIIFAVMATLAGTIKRDLSGMGKALFIGMIMLLVAAFANIFLQMPILSLMISGAAVLLISGAILWETSQLIHDPEANYIVIATSLLGSIWVLFMHLMRLFAFFSGED